VINGAGRPGRIEKSSRIQFALRRANGCLLMTLIRGCSTSGTVVVTSGGRSFECRGIARHNLLRTLRLPMTDVAKLRR
jgi:hypothetical protein